MQKLDCRWRVPAPVIPESVAVDAIMAGASFSEGMRNAGLPHLSVNFAGGLRAKTHQELWELVIAKLRELSQGESCN